LKTASQTDVLAWLAEHHPALHSVAELDRSWVWLAVDLRGDHNKPVRESIKEAGFRFAKRGHALPSGKQGSWAHHCQKPIPFHRKRKASGQDQTETTGKEASAEEILACLA